MTCEELRDQYELYALGALDAEERTELDAHLRREGDPCVAGVFRARQMMTPLALMTPESHPPARLRNKVVTLVKPKQSGSWTFFWVAANVCVIVVLFWALDEMRRGEQLRVEQPYLAARQELQRKNAELARLTEAFALMNDPAAKQVVFGEGAPKPPRGRVFVNPNRGVLLLASNLPPAPAGKIYEMWIIPKGGAPLPAGLFQSEADGTAMYVRKGPVDIASTAVIAVTLEPEAGSRAPTTEPLIAAAL
jgi:anti-sigma-K factor RskA